MCLAELTWTFIRDPFSDFIVKNGEEKLFFISAGNRSHNLTPKFETLSIRNCVVRMFSLPKRLLFLKF